MLRQFVYVLSLPRRPHTSSATTLSLVADGAMSSALAAGIRRDDQRHNDTNRA